MHVANAPRRPNLHPPRFVPPIISAAAAAGLHSSAFSCSDSSGSKSANIHGDLKPSDVRSKAMKRKLAAAERPSAVTPAATPPPAAQQQASSFLGQAWQQAQQQLQHQQQQLQVLQQQQQSPPQQQEQQQPQAPTFAQTMKFYVIAGFGMALGMMFVRLVFGF